jgi:hypothetical protein
LADPVVEREQATLTVWIDDSLSMQATEGGESRREVGLRLLESNLQDSEFTSISQRPLTFPSQIDTTSAHWLVTDGASERVRVWAQQADIERIIQVGTSTENVAVTRLAVRRGRRHVFGRSDIGE